MLLEEKIEVLWQEREVRNVVLRFGRALDTGDWPAYRSCFTDILNVDFKRLTGCAEVRVDASEWTLFAEQILSPVRRHHTYSNFDISIDGTKAHAVVYMTARHWKSTDFGNSDNTQYGWYEFWLERDAAGAWKIYRFKHDFQWVEGNGALLDMTEPVLARTMTKIFCQETVGAASAYLAMA